MTNLRAQDSAVPEKNPVQMEAATSSVQARAQMETVRDQERLAIAKEAANLGIHDFDLISQTIEADSRVREFWGIAPDEPFTYDKFISGLHPDDRALTESAITEALNPRGNGKYYAEYRVLSREEKVERWIGSAGRVFFEEGHAVRIVGTVQDISARKRAEEALRASEERYRVVVENTTAVILGLDTEGIIRFANGRALEFFGYSAEELIGKHAVGTIVPAQETTGRDLAAMVEQIAKNPEGFHSNANENMRKNGERVWLEWTNSGIYDVNGRLKEFLSVGIDFTERKRAEEAVRQSETRLVEAQRLARLGDWEWDPDSDHVVWSRGMYDVFSRSQELPPPNREELSRYYTAESWARLERAIRDTQETGEPYELELDYIREDGVRRSHLAHGEVVRDAVGRTLKIRGTSQDITDRKRAEEELRRAKEDLETRVSERTQELATRADQLRALAGELTLAEQRERSRLARVLHDHLQQLLVAAKFRITILGRGGDQLARKGTKEVEDLIDESIAASRSLTAELSPPILHEAGLNAGLQWLSRRMAETHRLLVHLELQESGPLPESSKILLFESVRELLFNVVKHAGVRSAAVKLRKFNNSLQVIVSDRGRGFDITGLAAAGESGKGFGIFVIRERLELMGGKFEIQSSPGQGTQFVMSMPVSSPETIKQQPQEPDVLPEEQLIPPNYHDFGKKIRVMLVDDHAVVRQGIANLLGDESDIEVVGQAADGQEAVDLASRLLPDVILMDLSMPKLNGVEATRLICNDRPEIRVIGLSMFEEADRAQAMRDAGAVDYLTKTGPADRLLGAIRTSMR